MSGQTGDKDDRTEAPTARRLQKAREEGEVPVSREAVLLAGLAAVTVTFLLLNQGVGLNLTRSLALILSHPGLPVSEPIALFHELVRTYVLAVAPIAAPVAVAATAATLMQTQFAMRTSALKVDFKRMSPAAGLKRMIGSQSLVEFAKSLAKLLVVGGAIVQVLLWDMPKVLTLPFAPLGVLPGLLMAVVIWLLLAVVLAQTVIAGADMFWLWRQHLRQLRMSRTDIKDEAKETDGDPATKMRIRRLRMRRARNACWRRFQRQRWSW